MTRAAGRKVTNLRDYRAEIARKADQLGVRLDSRARPEGAHPGYCRDHPAGCPGFEQALVAAARFQPQAEPPVRSSLAALRTALDALDLDRAVDPATLPPTVQAVIAAATAVLAEHHSA